MNRLGLKQGSLLPLLLAITSSCSDLPPPVAEELSESRKNLFGGGVVPGEATAAENLATAMGIAGTIAEIQAKNDSNGGAFSSRCTGVVVARDRVLTTTLCVTNPEVPTVQFTANQLRVALPNLGGTWPSNWGSGVSQVWIAGSTSGLAEASTELAILTLEQPVPFTTLGNVAPVYLGDVEDAIRQGVLVAADAVVAGFGPACDGCSGSSPTVRRLGPLGNPVFVDRSSTTPWLASRVPTNPGADRGAIFAESADPWLDGLDRGGPLFLREARTGRYVVAGVYVDRQARSTGDSYRFNFLGRIGNEPSNDHAEVIREQLEEFTDGEPCTPGGRATSYNSNLEAEWTWNWFTGLNLEHLEDRCDPVPLTTFDSIDPLIVPDPNAPLTITTRTWMGKGAVRTEGTATANLRYCSCFDLFGEEMPESACLDQCDTITLQNKNRSYWTTLADFYRRHPTGVWYQTSLIQSAVMEGQLGDKQVTKWDWHSDLTNGKIAAGPGGNAIGFLGTTGNQKWHSSERDESSGDMLRPTVVYLNLSPSQAFKPHPGVLVSRCMFPGCLPFIDPRDIYLTISRADIANPVIMIKDLLGDVVIPRGKWIWQDISSVIDPSLSQVLATAGIAWLPAVEGADNLASLGIDARAAVLTSDGKILEVVATEDGLAVPSVRTAMARIAEADFVAADLDGSESEELMIDAVAQAEAAAVAAISPPGAGRALYSASEGVIYQVVGGDKNNPGSITKTDVTSGVSSTIAIGGTLPSGEVLGAAYAPGSSTLYTLEATSDGKSEARIVAYDLASGTSGTLWSVPYTATYEFTSLSLTHEGELVLTVALGGNYSSWLIQVKANGITAFVGRLDREGSPLDTPAMGARGPALPILDGNGDVRMDSLDPREFGKGGPCTEL